LGCQVWQLGVVQTKLFPPPFFNMLKVLSNNQLWLPIFGVCVCVCVCVVRCSG
jgi:hypothetical protein